MSFYLEEPSIERKEEALEYLAEHKKYHSKLHGTGGMDKCLEDITYKQWLIKVERMKDNDYAKSIDKCPRKTFFLVRSNDNRLVGMITIRYNLNEAMLKFGGHIGYGIRPTERKKGYNKINLYLGLLKAKEDFGLEKVMLDCDVNNIASDKTIQALGGVLERCEIDPFDNTLTNVYWINVEDSIHKYQNIYSEFISERKKRK